jgi:hypothetical protein
MRVTETTDVVNGIVGDAAGMILGLIVLAAAGVLATASAKKRYGDGALWLDRSRPLASCWRRSW